MKGLPQRVFVEFLPVELCSRSTEHVRGVVSVQGCLHGKARKQSPNLPKQTESWGWTKAFVRFHKLGELVEASWLFGSPKRTKDSRAQGCRPFHFGVRSAGH